MSAPCNAQNTGETPAAIKPARNQRAGLLIDPNGPGTITTVLRRATASLSVDRPLHDAGLALVKFGVEIIRRDLLKFKRPWELSEVSGAEVDTMSANGAGKRFTSPLARAAAENRPNFVLDSLSRTPSFIFLSRTPSFIFPKIRSGDGKADRRTALDLVTDLQLRSDEKRDLLIRCLRAVDRDSRMSTNSVYHSAA